MHNTIALRETLSFSFNFQLSFIFLVADLLNLQGFQFLDVYEKYQWRNSWYMVCRVGLYVSMITYSAKNGCVLLLFLLHVDGCWDI